ncbi:hypothetical protein DFS33DRAFT_849484 [Desarmillaria ectypa]|nr:hypothetical protein DFS33DRAFT_849484 [Desarmillaria ectypa]
MWIAHSTIRRKTEPLTPSSLIADNLQARLGNGSNDEEKNVKSATLYTFLSIVRFDMSAVFDLSIFPIDGHSSICVERGRQNDTKANWEVPLIMSQGPGLTYRFSSVWNIGSSEKNENWAESVVSRAEVGHLVFVKVICIESRQSKQRGLRRLLLYKSYSSVKIRLASIDLSRGSIKLERCLESLDSRECSLNMRVTRWAEIVSACKYISRRILTRS